jgi:purine-nucleoside phosphorylase
MSHFEGLIATCQKHPPDVFLVLGSGLADVVDGLYLFDSCLFADVPEMPTSSVGGHEGILEYVIWDGKGILASVGRLHFYEGHPWETVVKPIRLAASLGIRTAILTNAAGGIRDDLTSGALMPLRDHLEWNRPYPWREPARPSPYSKRLVDLIATIGGASPPGIYASVTGPSYETPAEIRALRSQGADAVGMSTTREAIAAAEAGMEVAAISLITNRAAGLSASPLDHAEVLAVGREAAERMGRLLGSLLARL